MTTIYKGQMIQLLVNAGHGTAESYAGKTLQQVKKDYKAAFPKDTTLTSDQVKELGLKAGWDQSNIDAALANADANQDGVFDAAEFDSLVADIGADRSKSLLQALLVDPETFERWNVQASELGGLQAEADQQIADLLEVADDQSKTPDERLEAGEAALQLARLLKSALAGAGLGAVINMDAEIAQARQAVKNAELASGNDDVFEKELVAAGTDVNKLTAVMDQLPDNDPRKEVLESILDDGKVDGGIETNILAALKVKSDKAKGIAKMEDALKAAISAIPDGDVASIELVAKAYQAAAQGEDQAVADKFNGLSNTLTAISTATTADVREALLKGMDGKKDYKGVPEGQAAFAEAAKLMDSPEDLAALKAFAEQKKANGSKYYTDTFMNKLEHIEQNFDAFQQEPAVWDHMRNFLADKVDNQKDVVAAFMAATDESTLNALIQFAGERGTFLANVDNFDRLSAAFAGADLQAFVGLSADAKKAWLQNKFPASEYKKLGIQ